MRFVIVTGIVALILVPFTLNVTSPVPSLNALIDEVSLLNSTISLSHSIKSIYLYLRSNSKT